MSEEPSPLALCLLRAAQRGRQILAEQEANEDAEEPSDAETMSQVLGRLASIGRAANEGDDSPPDG